MPVRSNNAEVDPSSPAWQKYYADAARRRRTHRKQLRRVQEERKRRHSLETLFIIGSLVVLGAMTAFFHSVLTR
jgi:hypothetical protein